MAWINEIYDLLFHPDTICVASISYGKDSLAMLRAIKHLGLPLHRIVHSEVWATDTIPADLPPMVEFKKHADKIIKDLYGIEVEHICATRPMQDTQMTVATCVSERATNQCSTAPCKAENSQEASKVSLKPLGDGAKSSRPRVKLTYEDIFYRRYKAPKEGRKEGNLYGFPTKWSPWCNSELKASVLDKHLRIPSQRKGGMVPRTQTPRPTDFPSRSIGGNGANASSSFPSAPARGAVNISCNISALRRTSHCGSRGT